MKKILLLFSLIAALTANAQTVYFGNLSEKLGIGLGMPQGFSQTVIISIMQIDREKDFDDFSFKIQNINGEELKYNLVQDTIYHLNVDNTYNHQLDFKTSLQEYHKMCNELALRAIVTINGEEYNGAAFVGVLRALEAEQNVFGPQNFKNVTMWNWQSINFTKPNPIITNMQFMRFRIVKGPKEFRFIRRIENFK